ncbi:MAG: hypothetical protein J6P61_04965 [Erysipelotrichaceae bacterium]|nr:hypothetical protein [Erysipelotrichaceae bacterium]
MNKKTIIKFLEKIPIICALLSFVLLVLPIDAPIIKTIMSFTIPLAFLGFVFFFVGRKFCKEDKTVRFLGYLDLLATVFVIVLYILAIFSFGL